MGSDALLFGFVAIKPYLMMHYAHSCQKFVQSASHSSAGAWIQMSKRILAGCLW